MYASFLQSVLPMQEVHKSAVHEVVKKQDPYDEVVKCSPLSVYNLLCYQSSFLFSKSFPEFLL